MGNINPKEVFERILREIQEKGLEFKKLESSFEGGILEFDRWKFRIEFFGDSFRWAMWPVDHYDGIILEELSKKFALAAYVNSEGSWKNILARYDPIEINPLETFFRVATIYNKIFKEVEDIKKNIYKDATDKYSAHISSLIESL